MELKEENFTDSFLEKSKFEVLYAKHVEEHIKESLKQIKKKSLKQREIKITLLSEERVIKLRTTSKTRDPCAILKSKDFINLICKCVPFQKAERIFDDEISYAIINIGRLASSNDVFFK